MIRSKCDVLYLLRVKLRGADSVFGRFLLLPDPQRNESDEDDDQQQEEIYESVSILFLCLHRCLSGTSQIPIRNYFKGFGGFCPENTECSQTFQNYATVQVEIMRMDEQAVDLSAGFPQIILQVQQAEQEDQDLACQKPPQISFDPEDWD